MAASFASLVEDVDVVELASPAWRWSADGTEERDDVMQSVGETASSCRDR